MLVYRRDSRHASGRGLKRALQRALRQAERSMDREGALDALLRAGDLECALADAAHVTAPIAARITDELAARLLGECRPRGELGALADRLARHSLPDRLRIKTPEGYAYYGLHPLRYAELASARAAGAGPVGVIGIRSIGTSLGAVVCQALVQRGRPADRISVRPTGEPFARVLRLDAGARDFVRRICSRAGEFIVVDEGPGLSGSTFLAVCEALEACGASASRIDIFCSHQPDRARLLADGAAARWRRFRSHAAAPPAPRSGREHSAGGWRVDVYGSYASRWPATWVQLERAKWLDADARVIDKFEGLGPYGDEPFARARTLADAGYAPAARRVDSGYLRHAWLGGRPLRAADASPALLAQLARYCAFRSEAFSVSTDRADSSALEEMVRVNAERALGVDLGATFQLEVAAPVIADARMQPHEWRIDGDRERLFKIDGHGDGDGHLLPGPTDVCWDLAGAIVEWNLGGAAHAALASTYERLTGDPVSKRLSEYVACYCALRIGMLTLADHSAPADEAERLRAARAHHVRRLRRALAARSRSAR